MKYTIKKILPIMISLTFLVGCEEKRSVPKVDNLAPAYTLENMQNQTIDSKNSLGRVRLVVFWATWCKPCIKEVPVLNDLWDRYQGKPLDIHGISVDRAVDVDKIPRFMEKYGIKYPILKGSPQLQLSFRSDKVPTTYLLNQKGEYIRKWNGPQPAHVFIREIDKLLK